MQTKLDQYITPQPKIKPLRIKPTKPFTKTIEIETIYGGHFIWKHNDYEYKIKEDDVVISYFINWGHAGTLLKEHVKEIKVNYELCKDYNDFYFKN